MKKTDVNQLSLSKLNLAKLSEKIVANTDLIKGGMLEWCHDGYMKLPPGGCDRISGPPCTNISGW
jgi:hypothetical protein